MKGTIMTKSNDMFVIANNGTDSSFDAEAFERETGWQWGDAVDEFATRQREQRIFGDRHGVRHVSARKPKTTKRAESLPKGWTHAAMVDAAVCIRQEARGIYRW